MIGITMLFQAAGFWAILLLVDSFDIPLKGRDFPVKEYCDSERFRAECRDDEVIVVTSAWYGRHRIGRCVDRNYGNLGCKSDVISAVDAACSGLQRCEFEVDDDNFASIQPCPKDFKSHLLVSYSCVRVHKPSRPCRNMIGSSDESRDLRHISASSSSGIFLSSDVTRVTRCGAVEYPWILEAPEGQRIALSMIDFSLNGTTLGGADASRNPLETGVCLVYVSVRDGPKKAGVQRRSTTICGRLRPRMRHVFTSLSSYIEVRILQGDVTTTSHVGEISKRPRFLLKYEVVGCSDPPVPVGGWFKRVDDKKAIVGCKGRPQTESWSLECELSHWKGHVGNCSTGVPFLGELVNSGQGLPFGLSVALVVAIAFVISCLILLVGICIITRRNSRKRHLQEMQASSYGQSERGLRSGQPIIAADAKSKYESMKPNQSDNMYTDSGRAPPGGTDLYTLRSEGSGSHYPAHRKHLAPGSADYYPTSEHIYEYPTPDQAEMGYNRSGSVQSESSLPSGQYFDIDPNQIPASIQTPEIPLGTRTPLAKAACGHARPCTCTGGAKTQPDIL